MVYRGQVSSSPNVFIFILAAQFRHHAFMTKHYHKTVHKIKKLDKKKKNPSSLNIS